MLVYIFYRTDQWNTRSSEDLVYIGTNKEASIKKLMKLEDDPITKVLRMGYRALQSKPAT